MQGFQTMTLQICL